MAKAGEVLQMLCPNVEWSLIGQQYEDIEWLNGKAAITKKQFEDGFAKFDVWKTEQDAAKTEAKATAQAKLEALGLTVEDLTALGL
jgi:hypothetical protein